MPQSPCGSIVKKQDIEVCQSLSFHSGKPTTSQCGFSPAQRELGGAWSPDTYRGLDNTSCVFSGLDIASSPLHCGEHPRTSGLIFNRQIVQRRKVATCPTHSVIRSPAVNHPARQDLGTPSSAVNPARPSPRALYGSRALVSLRRQGRSLVLRATEVVPPVTADVADRTTDRDSAPPAPRGGPSGPPNSLARAPARPAQPMAPASPTQPNGRGQSMSPGTATPKKGLLLQVLTGLPAVSWS